jgi:mannose/fructose/N-acetylgalactosamine-specific phosphotransferase system component IIB
MTDGGSNDSVRRRKAVFILFLVLHPVYADVQQQQLGTYTIQQTALTDTGFPSDSNEVVDNNPWTNINGNVRLDSFIKIQFQENIQAGFGYITFQPPISTIGSSSSVATTLTMGSDPDVTVSGQSLIINNARHDNVFSETTTFTVSFDAGVVQDLDTPTDTNAAFSVQFTTGDFTDPSVISRSPVINSPAVKVGDNIVLTFSEAVQANAALMLTVNDWYQRQSPISQNAACNSQNVFIQGREVYVKLSQLLPMHPCQNYQLSYPAKCFFDTSPNENFAMALQSTANYKFFTSCITEYEPASLTIDHLIDTKVVLSFSEEVQPGTGNIVLTPLGEAGLNFDVQGSMVTFATSPKPMVTIEGDFSTSPSRNWLCQDMVMQNCKGKPFDVSIAAGVIQRTHITSGYGTLPHDLETQLTGSAYRFTLKAADLTPPDITIVSMYGISETVIRVTVRLDESGTTYCRAYRADEFTPVSFGGSNVPTMIDCTACSHAIKSDTVTNYVGSSMYDPHANFAEHEVDVYGLQNNIGGAFHWVYCYSFDKEIPRFNVVTSAQMLATQQKVRTLDTTPPTFTVLSCVPTVDSYGAGNENSITVTLRLNEPGRAYCKVVNRGFTQPSPNAVIAEGFFADTTDVNADFQITVDQITTGLGATGMQALYRKTDYDVYCWAQDAEGYPYHGPNGMGSSVACQQNYVTTLDLTPPNMRFVMAESISRSQILITLQVDEGAKVWCAAWENPPTPAIDGTNYESTIKGMTSDCVDSKGRTCGTFWVYDLDDIEDQGDTTWSGTAGAAPSPVPNDGDGVSSQEEYEGNIWKYNQDVDIIVQNLVEKVTYSHIYCYAEDDETIGIGGSSPNKMIFDIASQAGPNNVYTIKSGIDPVETLDESPPSFTKLSMLDPTAANDRIVVTFSLNEAGTTYCRVTRSDSGETTLRINRILSANYYQVVTTDQVASITVDKLDSRDSMNLYEAAQYDVYCWAKDSAVDTQGLPRPNYMIQDYVDNAVGLTGAAAASAPEGGKTMSVWVKDMTPPSLIYVSSEALTEDTIQVTIQLNEPGTVWCQPVLPSQGAAPYNNLVHTDAVDGTNYVAMIKGQSGSASFVMDVNTAFFNVDVEVNKIEDSSQQAASLLIETDYMIYCFADDDWTTEANNAAEKSINFNYQSANVGPPNEITYAAADAFRAQVGVVKTLDLTPPSISITGLSSGETTITVTYTLNEAGTAWCQAVRKGFNVPTILEILDTNFNSLYTPTQSGSSVVEIVGYDRPKNYDNTYLTPLVLGVDYDVYCYAEDDLCLGCKVTNGFPFSHVVETIHPIRTKDYTIPSMRFVFAESIARDQILITLQVDEGSKVWCAAWKDDPQLTASATSTFYESMIKNYSPRCEDNKGRQCGSFWIYDLDDIEDGQVQYDDKGNDGDNVNTTAQYDMDENWKYNQDVDIILYQLTEKEDYAFIYCYAEDDEIGTGVNKMIYNTAANAGPQNVFTMKTEIGTIKTLDESPPSFTQLQMEDPTAYNDRIIITFQLNEAGTAYCRTTRSDSGETTLRINQILTADFSDVVVADTNGFITVDKLESRDDRTLYEAAQYDIYCWAKDSAVDTQTQPRPNYMIQDYVDNPVTAKTAPGGGKTLHVWVKDTTPPTLIYVSSEAVSDESTLQITLQLNEPGTVWCHPVVPVDDSTWVDVDDVVAGNYMTKIEGVYNKFRQYVPIPFYNVDVEVDTVDAKDGNSALSLYGEQPYNIYCFAQDDWKIEAQYSQYHSENWDLANTATVNMTSDHTGNGVSYQKVVEFKDEIGVMITLDLTPPSMTISELSSTETEITVTFTLNESGTAWCQAVRYDFNTPTILEILDTNFNSLYNLTQSGSSELVIQGYDRPKNYDNSFLTPLVQGVDYDVFCYAEDDLCLGCKVTNGMIFSHVETTKHFIRTKDHTKPAMRFVFAESIARDQILITLQVDEGSKVWCAAWKDDPGLTAAAGASNYETMIKNYSPRCEDNKGRQCGSFWIYDLDDIEDNYANDGDNVNTTAQYDLQENWKYNQDVDIILYQLTEKETYDFIYCYAEDDEIATALLPQQTVNKMIYDTAANAGPQNVNTMKTEIGSITTLDESPPSFTVLKIQDPTAYNDRIIVTFQLNEVGTAYCRTTRTDSGETTLRINQILTADYYATVPKDTDGFITIDKLETRDDLNLYEAAQYDIYCWAKDSAVDTQSQPRPNYAIQDYVENLVGSNTDQPGGGKTPYIWVQDTTPPTIIVVSYEALAEDTVQITLQLNEPGTIWCQSVDKDTSAQTTTAGGYYCRDLDVVGSPTNNPCYYEDFIKGTLRGPSDSTVFRADIHVPYRDYDIDLNRIEKVTAPQAGHALTAQYDYKFWCFAEDDWKIEADNHLPHSALYVPPTLPNKVTFSHSQDVKLAIGGVKTLDQTPPEWTSISGQQVAESVLTMTMTLTETGTIWCKPVRKDFAEPSINEILQNNEYNANCGTQVCVVTVEGLQSKTLYDLWCYAEDDNVYPQKPNGKKFSASQKTSLSTLDTTPPVLTIVQAESPLKTDIRIKIRMEEPGTVWCNSFVTGTSYGTVGFDAVIAGGYKSYVGLQGQEPGGPIDTNVEVIVTDRIEQTEYDTFCTAQDISTLPSINKLLDTTTRATQPALGKILTLDESPPTFTKLGVKGMDENTVRITFTCNEACRAYCRVTRSDSGELSLSINRILKADFKTDQDGTGTDATIDISRLENDPGLDLLERGTLYDTYCWIKDEAQQHTCRATQGGSTCETFPKPNYQNQAYVDTAFGGTPPALKLAPLGGKMLHVRTPDTTPPNVIFIEAESTEETSITVTLQLDEPGTAYCKAYTTTQTAGATLYNSLVSSSPGLYKNTVTNWNNIYKNFEIKVADLSMETKYYVYCASEDDELMEGATTITPQPTTNNRSTPMLTESTGRFTLDLTPPVITMQTIQSYSETTSTIVLQLDEPGTAWCKAVRDGFDAPTSNQIIAANFYSTIAAGATDFQVQIENLERDTEYDVYCHARDRGTEVEVGTPDTGNPGNDVTFTHVLSTKRDIHTKGDSTAPVVISVSPVHTATAVEIRPIFKIVFNEDVQAGTGSLKFQPASGSDILFDITKVNTDICASTRAKLTIVLSTFTADFASCTTTQLDANMQWKVSFTAGVFKDDSPDANVAPAFGESSSYYFSTGAT